MCLRSFCPSLKQLCGSDTLHVSLLILIDQIFLPSMKAGAYWCKTLETFSHHVIGQGAKTGKDIQEYANTTYHLQTWYSCHF